MVSTVGILMVMHIAEVAVWALAYAILNVAPPGADVLYFAFVNYATLGYGDVVPMERWRLLGPMAAMSSALLFGWSTAVIFEVLRQSMGIRKQNSQLCSHRSARDADSIISMPMAGFGTSGTLGFGLLAGAKSA